MSQDIKPFLQYLEKEKRITRAEACALIVEAIKSSVEKSVMQGHEIEVNADPDSGKLEAFVLLQITDSVADEKREINPSEAMKYSTDARIGDIVRKPISVSELGRIAAKSTQQLINQKFRAIEKEHVYQEYKDKEGDIVTGTVRRVERGNIIVELSTAEAILPYRERSPGEEFRTGDRIRALLLKIDLTQRGPEFILSRANPSFVRRLLELEVAEIADGTVSIAAMARDPGYRTKIAVDSRDSKVDPVGACVGARGTRVRNIVKELNNEKIDIIRWQADPLRLLEEAIKPAKPRNVRVDERNRQIHFEVAEDDMRIAIGKGGRNARLTSKLMGWRLDIAKSIHVPDSVDDQLEQRARALAERLELDLSLVGRIVGMGVTDLSVLEGMEASDFTGAGFSPEEAAQVVAAAAKARQA
ncbi:MAG TPA: transcription termination/antitermination protein NusA [Opitutae bacterium]|jgi:N utilization substance protein A|nr:transcription termination/antitermination protein NusA [Opitutae bacterium]